MSGNQTEGLIEKITDQSRLRLDGNNTVIDSVNVLEDVKNFRKTLGGVRMEITDKELKNAIIKAEPRANKEGQLVMKSEQIKKLGFKPQDGQDGATRRQAVR